MHIDWLAPGHPMGAGNPTISRETKTQVPAACQPQPRQPHIIKLISQLQKPTRRITDTWIVDTGKRKTRYQLVKVHQTIWRPHSSPCRNGFRDLPITQLALDLRDDKTHGLEGGGRCTPPHPQETVKDREVWRAVVHWVTKSQTWLSYWSTW